MKSSQRKCSVARAVARTASSSKRKRGERARRRSSRSSRSGRRRRWPSTSCLGCTSTRSRRRLWLLPSRATSIAPGRPPSCRRGRGGGRRGRGGGRLAGRGTRAGQIHWGNGITGMRFGSGAGPRAAGPPPPRTRCPRPASRRPSTCGRARRRATLARSRCSGCPSCFSPSSPSPGSSPPPCSGTPTCGCRGCSAGPSRRPSRASACSATR
mmetsp:Transcript_13140/g.38937  ORF Transcript_13140/g.38937 Transcript_13140/m.38937 type:complete len:211 (-) Transcript_13140:28-660(-)